VGYVDSYDINVKCDTVIILIIKYNQMKKEKCEKCGRLVAITKIDEHHIYGKNKPEKIKVCKDCHFKVHKGESKTIKGVWKGGLIKIPKRVLYDSDLTHSAKILYAILVDKCDKNMCCETNNREISEIMQITRTQTSRLFSKIEKYIIVKDRTMPSRKIKLVK